MACYAPRLEHETAIETGWPVPAVSQAGPKLFLVREAVAEPYRVKEAGADAPVPASHGDAVTLPEAATCAAPLPESHGDVLDALEEEIVVLSAHIHAATHRLLTLIARYDSLRGWELAGLGWG